LLALSACAGEPETPSESSDSGGEVVVEDEQGDDGGPAEAQPEERANTTPAPAAAYGGPPEPLPQPLYGVPAD
jgi:hypothetical protein